MAACKQCGKPKLAARKGNDRKVKAEGGTRMPRQLWLYHLEQDPFCSRECAEAFHNVAAVPPERECAHPRCSNVFKTTRDRPTRLYCSRKCATGVRTVRLFNDPGKCFGCGGDHENITKGCRQCHDRERRRRRRRDPALRAKDRELWKAAYQRRKERKRLEAAA